MIAYLKTNSDEKTIFDMSKVIVLPYYKGLSEKVNEILKKQGNQGCL